MQSLLAARTICRIVARRIIGKVSRGLEPMRKKNFTCRLLFQGQGGGANDLLEHILQDLLDAERNRWLLTKPPIEIGFLISAIA
ncbi:MAG TPA: hypothetical protein VGI40_00870 [Pirellulaceae bacterium]|jgi:hypothetical protein